MTDLPGAADEAAAIHAAFARTVQYYGAGLARESVSAVRSHRPGENFMHGGGSVRELWYEIRKASLPEEPDNGDLVFDLGATTQRRTLALDFRAQSFRVDRSGLLLGAKVIEVVDRDDVDAWLIKVAAA